MKIRIAGNDCKMFNGGLCNLDPIKRIAMVQWETDLFFDMLKANWQFLEMVDLEKLFELGKWKCKFNLTDINLDTDFL